MSTKNSRATSSSKQLLRVTSPANTVHVSGGATTWTGTYSDQSSTNAASTGQGAFLSTYLENLFYTRISLKRYGTLSAKTNAIPSFLRQMGRSLTSLPDLLWNVELTESSGPGGEIILRLTPSRSLNELVLYGSSSKKPLKKNLKNGRNSRGSK